MIGFIVALPLCLGAVVTSDADSPAPAPLLGGAPLDSGPAGPLSLSGTSNLSSHLGQGSALPKIVLPPKAPSAAKSRGPALLRDIAPGKSRLRPADRQRPKTAEPGTAAESGAAADTDQGAKPGKSAESGKEKDQAAARRGAGYAPPPWVMPSAPTQTPMTTAGWIYALPTSPAAEDSGDWALVPRPYVQSSAWTNTVRAPTAPDRFPAYYPPPAYYPAAPLVPEKPFANYQPPATVSPYMNLFRTDTYAGTLNNYNLWVVPQVQQQQFNQQMNSNVNTLNNRVLQQYQATRQMDQQMQNPGYMVVPQYSPGQPGYRVMPTPPTTP